MFDGALFRIRGQTAAATHCHISDQTEWCRFVGISLRHAQHIVHPHSNSFNAQFKTNIIGNGVIRKFVYDIWRDARHDAKAAAGSKQQAPIENASTSTSDALAAFSHRHEFGRWATDDGPTDDDGGWWLRWQWQWLVFFTTLGFYRAHDAKGNFHWLIIFAQSIDPVIWLTFWQTDARARAFNTHTHTHGVRNNGKSNGIG